MTAKHPGGSVAAPPTRARGWSWKRLAPLVILVAGAAAAWWAFGGYLSFETLRDNRGALMGWRDSNYAAAAATYLAVYVAVVAFSLPGALMMTLTGGFLFGLVAGGLLTLTGATLGATAIFLAAKTGLGDRLQETLKDKGGMMARFQKGIAENELSFLFLMRLVPAVPFFLANLAPAFLGVSLRRYVFTTFFGIMPGTVVYTWVGSGLGEVFERGDAPDLGILFEPQVLAPILALCALAALPIVLRQVRGPAKAEDEG